MFLQFFYSLRATKIPVSTTELFDLLVAVEKYSQKLGYLSLKEFYSIARSCLIKDIKYYDDYDMIFAKTFGDLAGKDSEFRKLLEEWLQKSADIEITEEKKRNAMNLDPDELFEELQKRLQEQKEKHDGGNYWIGTSGTSAFGNSGYNPAGVRIGKGSSMGRSAIQVFADRKYREYRTDESLNVRHIKVALKKLKELRKQGRKDFSIDKTIDRTCENGGDIELVFTPSRKNQLKLMLLMDVGGSMSPHAERVSKLFSAAHQLNHFKEFHYYYFHNIMYEYVYEDALFTKKISLERLIKKISKDTKVIFVGDAAMNPYELFGAVGRYYYRQDDKKMRTGMESLKFLLDFYEKCIWLNPDDKRYWEATTCDAIWSEVPMYYLSVDGLSQGIKALL
jgi:uncharacterized protein with von Willebrand factor type A (vWA) domain